MKNIFVGAKGFFRSARTNKFVKTAAIVCAAVALLAVLFVCVSNIIVVESTKNRILLPEEAASHASENGEYDCILVLGCLARSVYDEETGDYKFVPSDMLEDRLLAALKAYEDGAAPKIVVSGDHGRDDYDEVNTMKNFLIDKGVPSGNILMDYAGFSTYDSIYRVKEIFGAKRIIAVTQSYHLYRTLYIADSFGIEAVGVSADLRIYGGQSGRELREIIARTKDFLMSFFKPEASLPGRSILGKRQR